MTSSLYIERKDLSRARRDADYIADAKAGLLTESNRLAGLSLFLMLAACGAAWWWADHAVIDITGVPTVDSQIAQHLIETVSAVRLLGADVIMTGIRAGIAQTLVHLGIDLSGTTTRSSLVDGLGLALERLGLQVVPHPAGPRGGLP